ncbi:hypothetical protein LC605_21630 [Nostoc sp. CHAB 5836]|nr:hypothetical protein [Nostoc sp. CHAB 5836]
MNLGTQSPLCTYTVLMGRDNCGINHRIFIVGIICQLLKHLPSNEIVFDHRLKRMRINLKSPNCAGTRQEMPAR